MDTPDLLLGLTWYVVFILSATIHEAGHALAALRLGDSTAYHGGQVTLDPIPHIQREPVGMIVVPIASFLVSGFMIGWASAPYDPFWAQRYPRRAALMALAGPAGNLLILIVVGLLIRGGMLFDAFSAPDQVDFVRVVDANGEGFAVSVARLLSIAFTLNLLLFVFNLLPLPPLDGSAAVPLILSTRAARAYQEFLYNPTYALLGLIVAWHLMGRLHLFWKALLVALKALYPEHSYG